MILRKFNTNAFGKFVKKGATIVWAIKQRL
jgi:hypothetical protein